MVDIKKWTPCECEVSIYLSPLTGDIIVSKITFTHFGKSFNDNLNLFRTELSLETKIALYRLVESDLADYKYDPPGSTGDDCFLPYKGIRWYKLSLRNIPFSSLPEEVKNLCNERIDFEKNTGSYSDHSPVNPNKTGLTIWGSDD